MKYVGGDKCISRKKLKPLFTVVGMQHCTATTENSMGVPQKIKSKTIKYSLILVLNFIKELIIHYNKDIVSKDIHSNITVLENFLVMQTITSVYISFIKT